VRFFFFFYDLETMVELPLEASQAFQVYNG